MTLEQTIQHMFNKYPDLYQTRKDCLNHLFCVIGNGYEWFNGQLVNRENCKIRVDTGEIISVDEPIVKLKGNNVAKQTELSYLYKSIYKYSSWEWYPTCEYSKINTYPDNIQEDWLLGIAETMVLILGDEGK